MSCLDGSVKASVGAMSSDEASWAAAQVWDLYSERRMAAVLLPLDIGVRVSSVRGME